MSENVTFGGTSGFTGIIAVSIFYWKWKFVFKYKVKSSKTSSVKIFKIRFQVWIRQNVQKHAQQLKIMNLKGTSGFTSGAHFKILVVTLAGSFEVFLRVNERPSDWPVLNGRKFSTPLPKPFFVVEIIWTLGRLPSPWTLKIRDLHLTWLSTDASKTQSYSWIDLGEKNTVA